MTDGIVSEDMVKRTIALQRPGSTDDMGGLVIFLASKVCSHAAMSSSLRLIMAHRRGPTSTASST